MRVRLEQVFYGRGDNGYAVLGVSPGGRPLARRVAALCGAVGTPGGNYGGEPFLLSVPDGDRVVMVRGRRGNPDSMGRETLFYHALAGGMAELKAAHADAFTLDAQRVFADRMPDGEVEALDVEIRPRTDVSPAWAGTTPCLIRADKPAPEAVRAAVGEHANEWAWADFTFQAMDGFVVQVVPPRASGLRGVSVYDASGRLLRAENPQTVRGMATGNAYMPDRGRRASDSKPTDSDGASGGGDGLRRKTPGLGRSFIFFSLATNVALLLVCAVLLARGGTVPGEPAGGPVFHPDEIRKEAVAHFRAALAEAFPADARITDFQAARKNLPKAESIETDEKFKEANDFLRRTKAYVDFVESRIFDNNPTPENDRP